MNTTTARSQVRNKLGEPTPGAYTDAQIDAALRVAFDSFAPRFRRAASESVSVAVDAVRIPATDFPMRVVDAAGFDVPYATAPITARDRHFALAWRMLDAGEITLSRPVLASEAGIWTLVISEVPAMPSTVNAEWEMPDAFVSAVISQASAALLRMRLGDDMKRGHRSTYSHIRLAQDLEREARETVDRARRRARVIS